MNPWLRQPGFFGAHKKVPAKLQYWLAQAELCEADCNEKTKSAESSPQTAGPKKLHRLAFLRAVCGLHAKNCGKQMQSSGCHLGLASCFSKLYFKRSELGFYIDSNRTILVGVDRLQVRLRSGRPARPA